MNPTARRAYRWAALAAVLVSSARAAAESAPSPPPTATWLRPYVKSLSRAIDVYHYGYRPLMGISAEGPVQVDAAFREAYLQKRLSRFWDPDLATRPYSMASGLFASIDPVIGRTFGGIGDAWAMFALTFKKGFRFIDVRGSSDGQPERFSEPMRAHLTAAGCSADSVAVLLTGVESPACREIALKTVRALNLDAILYSYQGFEFEGCARRSTGAFIVLRTSAIERSVMLTNDAPPPKEASPDHLVVRDLYARARKVGSMQPIPWPVLEGQTPPPDMQKWMQEHLFGCGNHAEDRFTR
jgi:hypothetical protein